jgi:hypothetical protein
MIRMPLIEDIAELPFLVPEMVASPNMKGQPHQSNQMQPQMPEMPEIKIIPGQPARLAIQQIAKKHKIDLCVCILSVHLLYHLFIRNFQETSNSLLYSCPKGKCQESEAPI